MINEAAISGGSDDSCSRRRKAVVLSSASMRLADSADDDRRGREHSSSKKSCGENSGTTPVVGTSVAWTGESSRGWVMDWSRIQKRKKEAKR